MDENEEFIEEETLDGEEPFIQESYPKSHQNAKSIPDKARNAAGNTVKNTGSVVKGTGNVTKAAGTGMQAAGKGTQIASKGMRYAGSGIKTASNAAGTALSAIPYVGSALGGAVKGIGNAAGTGIETAGKIGEKTGQKLDKAGQKTKETGNKIKEQGDKIEKKAEELKDPSKTIKKGGEKLLKPHTFSESDITPLGRVKGVFKHWKLYLGLAVGAIFSIIMIFYFIMSPVIDALDKFLEFMEGATKAVEKSGNLYSGLGYKTTEDAFYEEMEYLYNKSAGELDLPLVMSALYYSETRNDYQTDYEESDDSEDSKNILNEVNDKYSESNKYTQGMILRLRKLNSGMLEATIGEKVTLSEFINRYSDVLESDIANLKDPLIGAILSTNPISMSFEVLKSTVNLFRPDTFSTTTGETTYALSQLLETQTMGLISISTMEFGLEDGKPQIYVNLVTKKYEEEKFKSYLFSYYIRKMPEFKPFIKNLEGAALDKEIEKIINEIYEHASWYTNVYGQIAKSAEAYNSTCAGGIPRELIPELNKPVDISNNQQISFNSPYSYGIRNGSMHNGVDINTNTTGTKEGDDVYAIASGKVISSEPNVKCNTREDPNCTNTAGAWVRIKHSIIANGNKYEFISVYMHLQANSGQPKVGDKVQKGDVIGKVGNTGNSEAAHLHFEYRSDDGTDYGQSVDPTNLFIDCSSELTGNDVPEKIWFFLRNLGYSKEATAAAMGNIQHESGGFQVDIIEHGTGIGYGLCQWSYGRRTQLEKYAKTIGKERSDLTVQLEFLSFELDKNSSTKYATWQFSGHETQYAIWKNASSASDINSATEAFCFGFERPNREKAALATRQKYANQIYNKYKDATIPSTSTVTNQLSGNANNILESAKQIKEYIASHGYRYGGMQTNVKDATKSRTVDCSSFVSWVLYNAGYTQFGGHQQTDGTFRTNSWKFQEISKSKVQPGDILVFAGHVEIFYSYANGTLKVYNAGSPDSVKVPGITVSGHNFNQIQKILRP